jgi:DNA-directed RNA polymerase subunit RPC12/RpoP
VKIQRYLRTQNDRFAKMAVVLLLVVGASAGYAPRSLALRISLAVLVLAAVGAAFWSLFEIRCPNCSKPLGMSGFLGAIERPRATSARRCPHCGISFDSEMPTR